MPTSSTKTPQANHCLRVFGITFLLWVSHLPFSLATNIDNTGKSVTFYPSSLMISHTAQPLVFFSETKLMHLTTRLKAIPAGPSLHISNNCSSTQQEFFDSLLNSIHGTPKVATRLLSLSSFSNFLECDSYLRRYFTYATGLPSRMVCPRHYRTSLDECKVWALHACTGLSSHEKMFLSTHTRQRRSSFMCHAGFFGIFRKIYTSLGHSCEPTIVSNLKDSLRHMSAGLGYAHSITRVLNGKITYLVKTTDALTTKLNRLSSDLKTVDQTFKSWQIQLNRLAAENHCHDSMMLEFLSKHSNAVNRAFASLLRLAEMQDILHQFSMLETQTLFGFPHLPSFLHPKIIVSLATDSTMKYTLPALKEGFPLLINPMVDIEHTGHSVEASVLLTIPEIPNLNAFYTVEYLTPIKYTLADVCYSGPVTKGDLVLISCPNSQSIVVSEALKKCYHDATAFICPSNVLTLATNISRLGSLLTLTPN